MLGTTGAKSSLAKLWHLRWRRRATLRVAEIRETCLRLSAAALQVRVPIHVEMKQVAFGKVPLQALVRLK